MFLFSYKDDEEMFKAIASMDVYELLDSIMNDPSVLTDPYYRDIGMALKKRGWEVLDARKEQLEPVDTESVTFHVVW